MNTSTRIMKAALWGGLIAATADMGYALIHYHFAAKAPFLRIPQSIAAGLIGREASFSGGMATALLGGVLHYFILIVASGIYAGVSLKLVALVKHPWVCGIAFGLAVFGFMHFVVVPLSAVGPGKLPQGQFLVGELLSHMIGVGVPIAFMARRYCELAAMERTSLATSVG